MKTFKNQIPVLLAMAIILLAGVGHGDWTNRWGLSHELNASIVRVPQLPLVIGDWKGEDIKLTDEQKAQMVHGEIVAYAERRYVNRRTLEEVELMLLSGRPGPIATHTPEICYGGLGYELTTDSADRYTLPAGSDGRTASFMRGDFRKSSSVLPDGLRIYWSWSPNGTWTAVDNPRISFAPYRCLYKIYVIRRTTDTKAEDAGAQFLKVLVPALQATLFDPAAPAASKAMARAK